MTSAVQQLIDLLVADMESSGDTAYTDALLAAAKTQIAAGQGTLVLITSASVSGKTFTGTGTLSALDTAQAARRALDLYNEEDGSSRITFPDFSDTFR